MSTIRLHFKILHSPPQIDIMTDAMKLIYQSYSINAQVVSTQILTLPDLIDIDVGSCRMGTTTAEQDQLFNINSGVGLNEIVVYFVASTNPPTNGCSSHPNGKPGAIITHIANKWTLAHEIGHLLGLNHIVPTDNLMYIHTEGITISPPHLSSSQIATINSSILVS